MFEKKGTRAFLITIGGGVAVFLLALAFLGSLRSTKTVVVASRAIPAGARLNANYLTTQEIHSSGVKENSLETIEDAEGQVLTVARAKGDQVTADMLGDQAAVGIDTQLEDGHRAVAVHVNRASGLVGVVQPGDRVGVVAVLSSSDLEQQMSQQDYAAPVSPKEERQSGEEEDVIPTPTRRPPSPASRVALSGLRVLLVPQTFRYEETLPAAEGEEGAMLAPARTSVQAQQEGVILLSVPTDPVPISDETDIEASPAALLPLLDAEAQLHLILEPSGGDGVQIKTGANLGDLYHEMMGWTTEPMTDTLEASDILSDAMGTETQ